MRRTTTWLVLAGLAMGLAACGPQARTDSRAGRPLLLNITSGVDDPHAVTMALQLAGHGLDDGREVVLFFNVRGVKIPTTGLDPLLAHRDKPIRTLLADCIKRGAIVYVCPHCMKAMDIEQDQLVDRARVATSKTLFAGLDSNAAVFTY